VSITITSRISGAPSTIPYQLNVTDGLGHSINTQIQVKLS